MRIATKTLEAINEAMIKDQGAKYRGLLRKLMPLAEDAYREEDGGFRSHLGASLIGRECARELWYSFHWTLKPKFDGRMLRLFNRGHLEEPRMVALLEMIGCQVWQYTPDGKQFRLSGHGGHYSGSLDGVAVGIPDLPEGIPCLTEFKTHGEKSFIKLIADGVISAKWEHFIQMQEYMGYYQLPYALYMAVNKNTDEIHAEIVEADPGQYTKYYDRAGMIIQSVEPPPKISLLPAYFKCKFCDFHKVCHGGIEPDRNCRTCAFSRASAEGEWLCENEEIRVEADIQGWEDPIALTKEAQLKGCEKYQLRNCYKK